VDLVFTETCDRIIGDIASEWQIKGWTRV